jgi:gluconolactonase
VTSETYETITSGLRFPEGPVVLQDGSVIVVEIERQTITRCHPDGTTSVLATPGGGPNGAAIGPDGALYICNNGGFDWHDSAETGLRPISQASDYSGGRLERLDLETGALTCLYTASDKGALKGPNDLVFDTAGGVYFSDYGKMRPRDMDRGAICYARVDGSDIREIIGPLHSPNGLGLSPDEKTLWVVETFTCRLWAFDLSAPGEVARQPWPASPNGGRFVADLSGYRGFDSLAVDADGNVCIATLFDGAITVISPEGELVESVPFDDPYCTNIAFGGEDMRDAYITLSSTGRLVRMRWNRPGLKLAFNG